MSAPGHLTPPQTFDAYETRQEHGAEELVRARATYRDARREIARLMGPMAETPDPDPVLKHFERAVRRLVMAEDKAR